MKYRGWIIMLGIGVVALGAWSAYRPSDNQSGSDAEARLASLEAEIRRLEAKNSARTWMNREVQQPMPALSHAPGSAAATPDEAQAEHASENEMDSPPVLEDRLEEAFAVEMPDPGWAGSATDHIHDVFSSALPSGSWIREVTCRASLCRVEIAHAAEDAHAELIRTLTENPGLWEGPGSIAPGAESAGEATTLAFFGRPGSDLVPGSIWQ
jgi:hypothetical protein